jgi:hypothetical protein
VDIGAGQGEHIDSRRLVLVLPRFVKGMSAHWDEMSRQWGVEERIDAPLDDHRN